MVDRQDIDALLIGSLYGELSSAEEARLTAHLDSHPSDRTALANLSHAREVVRESRILQVQFEPSQSISALLMQEAARRAPKPRSEHSWFQRFMRSFMTHPAMAAAAMLVLIVGVAGTVYMRKGDHFANQTKDDAPSSGFESSGSAPSGLAPNAPSVPAADSPSTTITTAEEQKPESSKFDDGAQGEIHRGSGSASITISQADDFKVQLREDALKKAPADKVVGNETADRSRNAEGKTPDGRAGAKTGTNLAFDASERRDQKNISKETDAETVFGGDSDTQQAPKLAKPPKTPAPAPKTTAKPVAKTPPRLDVTTPTQVPKDFDSTSSTKKVDSTGTGGASAPRSPSTDPRPGGGAPPPAPPPPPAAAPEEKERQEKLADANLVWAKERHGKLIAAVKAGNCPSAATIAAEISNRTPAYYASNVESDRAIKNCQQYIAQQREKEAERIQRAKATQRRPADEAPAPARESTK